MAQRRKSPCMTRPCVLKEKSVEKKTSILARRNSERSARRLHLVGPSDTDAHSVSDELVTAADASEEDDEKALERDGQPEQSVQPIEGIDDLVGLYLREMGVTPMLTREGETALALRIERGRRRTAKAIWRLPICIVELIAIGGRLKR